VIKIASVNEVRRALKEDITQLKEIWRLCFNDTSQYIDYYFANQFKEEQTMVLIKDDAVAAMLSIKPVNLITWDEQIISMAMLYAIATHPDYQKQGLASQLIAQTNKELSGMGIQNTILVPATEALFGFYKKQGYHEAFYIREQSLTPDQITASHPGISFSCNLQPVESCDYNLLRNKFLNGSVFVAYDDSEVQYQKDLAQQSGADIYRVELPDMQGCAIIERIDQQKVIIKELLIHKAYFPKVLRHIADTFPAEEYLLRTSGYMDHKLAGSLRPFGMIKENSLEITYVEPQEKAYLGLAFD
jgi:predicted acetyltransferase